MGGSDAATLLPAVTDGSLNILYMVLEDFRALSMSAYCGSISSPSRPCASTPRLDGLVKEGVLFEHAFAQSPICNPSRTSMMTGRYPSTTGVLSNDDSYIHAAGLPNLPRLLRRHARGRIVTCSPYSKVFHLPAAEASVTHQPWDRTWWNATNWKAVPSDIMERLSKGAAPPKRVMRGPGYGHVKEDVYYHMAFRRTVAILAALLAQSTPFFYGFGLSGTHVPLAPPKRFVDKYAAAADELPLPPVHEPHGPLLARKDGFQSYVLTPAQQRGYTATYLAAAEYVDAQVGAILSLLQAFPAASARTAVVVHADHGFHLGEHGRWSKYTLYEESVRVPLIVRVPGGLRGVRSASIVELVDVLPTLLSLWGVGPSEQPPRLDGRSLVPLLTPRAGGTHPPSFRERPHARSEMRHPMLLNDPAGRGSRWVCGEQHYLRTEHFSFTAYLHEARAVNTTLFGLDSDPHEQHNLVGLDQSAWPYSTLRTWARLTAAEQTLWPSAEVAARDERARRSGEPCGEYTGASGAGASGGGRARKERKDRMQRHKLQKRRARRLQNRKFA